MTVHSQVGTLESFKAINLSGVCNDSRRVKEAGGIAYNAPRDLGGLLTKRIAKGMKRFENLR
jgi:hypothetical protein